MGLDIYFEKCKVSEISYFRKVNFLVSFIENYYDVSVENLQFYNVDKDCIESLLDRCNKVLDNHDLAEELLPTCSGFFFGNTGYDEYYFNKVEAVRNNIIDVILPEFDNLKDDECITFKIWY